jgi:hypothetical protein
MLATTYAGADGWVAGLLFGAPLGRSAGEPSEPAQAVSETASSTDEHHPATCIDPPELGSPKLVRIRSIGKMSK